MSCAAPRLSVRFNDSIVHHCAVSDSQGQSYQRQCLLAGDSSSIACAIVPSSMEQYQRNNDLAGKESQLSQDEKLRTKTF